MWRKKTQKSKCDKNIYIKKWECDKYQKLNMWSNLQNRNLTNLKNKNMAKHKNSMWLNSKTQNVSKLINSKWGKTQKLKIWQNKKLKMWQNSKTLNVTKNWTKLENS